MTNTLTAEQKLETAIHNAMIDTVRMDDDSEYAWQKAVSAIALAVAPFVSPDLPSPPVSGEAVMLGWRDTGLIESAELLFKGVFIGKAFRKTHGLEVIGYVAILGAGYAFDDLPTHETFEAAKAALETEARTWLSPLTNEPVASFASYMQAPMEASPMKSPHSAGVFPKPDDNEPVGVTTRWQHRKRGTVYTEIGRGLLQCTANPALDDQPVVIYQGEDGKLWVRGVSEFEDGRFYRLSAAIGERE